MNSKRYPLKHEEKEGAWYLTSPDLREDCGIAVAFTSRRGGVSAPPYDSLNLSFRVGDNPSKVNTNRSVVSTALAIDPDSWILGEQVHGLNVEWVEEGERGRSRSEGIAGADGLLTQTRGLTLAVLCADCVPVVLVHPPTRTLGIAHAGWKGTLGGIGQKLARNMRKLCGAEWDQVCAFIGPAIGSCCYEVPAERFSAFARVFGQISKRENHVDLAGVIVRQFLAEGIPQSSIEDAGACTLCQSDDFFSFRASGGTTGRQAGLVALL
jgi:YfiH family protein